jgi:hypothetical protein
MLLTIFYLSLNLPALNPSGDAGGGRAPVTTEMMRSQQQQHRSHASPRIAILLPYAARGLPTVLPYLLVFCKGAAGAADIADFIVVHNGVLQQWPRLRTECPPNVIFHNLESNRGMALRLLRVLDDPPGIGGDDMDVSHENSNKRKMAAMDDGRQEELLDLVASFIKINPYGLVEFKPALGHIFAEFIEGYSHWGYSDFDILFGDLSRWITPDELTDFDIVTYGYGDQQRVYLRGQFTFHKNDRTKVNQLWRACEYLTHLDERFEQILQRKKHYRTESAEGCYSAAILDRTDLKVKYAVKAWTDTQDYGGRLVKKKDDTFATHGVYLTTFPKTRRQILYKAVGVAANAKQVSIDLFSAHSVYSQRDQPLQRTIGAMENMEWTPHPAGDKCMYWVLPKYQKRICTGTAVAEDETVYWVDGQLYKQRFEAVQHGDTTTGPFFHYQEWKRYYSYGQLASMHPSSKVSTFLLSDKGALPVFSNFEASRATKNNISPLGLDMAHWHGVELENRSQLPGNVYCLSSELDQSKSKLSCTGAAVWTNVNSTDVLASAKGWNEVDTELDVSLVLTMQINEAQSGDREVLKGIVDHVSENIERWYGQPSVVVMFISGATEETVQYLHGRLGPESSFGERIRNTLIAAVYDQTDVVVSRKALLNMAIDAVPTRWYISGLELERGLVISNDASFFASRMAAAHRSSRGNMFWIPQFGLETEGGSVGDVTKLLDANEKSEVRFISEYDGECTGEHSFNSRIFEPLDVPWWKETQLLLQPQEHYSLSSRAEVLQIFETRFLELLGDSNADQLLAEGESPILLIDNAGPFDGIVTSEIVREIEELHGPTCHNAIKVGQLAALGYRINVLPGVFAASSDSSRKFFSSVDKTLRCQGCSATDKDMEEVLHRIATDGIRRAADACILWMEKSSAFEHDQGVAAFEHG